MPERTQPIHHLTPASALCAGLRGAAYAPARLPEDGFVHCTHSAARTLAVADDYFAGLDEPLVVLVIDPARLSAPLRFEAPAPIAGGGRAHLDGAETFPHVYGPIERAAITAAGVLGARATGFAWPESLEPLDTLLERLAGYSSATPK